MKPLSIEEKAKRYDEALEAVKSLREVNPSDEGIQNWVNENFPELKESDDEKIISAIRKALKSMVENLGNGVTRTACLAWLERQGKQKTVDETAKDVCKDKASAEAFLKSSGIMNEKGELAEQYRQDEQKSTLSNDDERIRKAIYIYLDWLDGRNKDYQPKGDYTIRDMIAWLKRQGEQKTVLSDENEKIRKWLIGYFNQYIIDGMPQVFGNGLNVKDVLAWLEKQTTPQVRTGIEWVNTIDDACDARYAEEYSHGEYCHEQSFKWGFNEGVEWLEKQGNKDSQVKLPVFTFDNVLALQNCMETVKKVQEDKELYEQLQSLHDRVHDAYWLEKQTLENIRKKLEE